MNVPAKADKCQKSSGFTLVEVLVALFIFSILSAVSLAVLTSVLRSKNLMNSKNVELRQRATLRILLKSDFAHTLAIPKTDEFGQAQQAMFVGGSLYTSSLGEGGFLSISRAGWDNPGGIESRSDLQAVEYALVGKTLVRKVHARFNPIASTPILTQELMQGIERVSMSFYDSEQWTDNWLTGNPPLGVTNLPYLASIELELSNGDTLKQIFRVGADAGINLAGGQ